MPNFTWAGPSVTDAILGITRKRHATKDKPEPPKAIEWTVRNKSTEYPAVDIISAPYMDGIIISHSPFADCQTATLGSMEALLNVSLSKADIKNFITKVIDATSKHQFIIDVRQSQYTQLLELLMPFIHTTSLLPFKSTNGSDMIIILVQFKKNIT